MVISAPGKMFLVTCLLFALCVSLFFVVVSMKKNEKILQRENFIRRGQSRQTEAGATNHWYFVVRDVDKIKAISDVRNIERASRIEKTATGFVVYGVDYEIVFDRVAVPSSEPEDYALALVKRRLYRWDAKPRSYDDKG
ncbi:uncharacterized protein LOC135702513 [Ochlerotatus camptorhynchus]|uniref:uncharacterized protein LOC135702513 n=1 Tax=Ochlerotatus camptorhynchus TaxID=644619 RepID=UPI0031DC1730